MPIQTIEKLLQIAVNKALGNEKPEIEFDNDSIDCETGSVYTRLRKAFNFSIQENGEVRIGHIDLFNPDEETLVQTIQTHYAPSAP